MKKKLLLSSVAALAVISLAGCESERGEHHRGGCCHSEKCAKRGQHEDKDAKDNENEDKDSQAKLLAEAKVSKDDAAKTALAQVPGGTIKEGELEKEKGKLIWSFDITTEGSKDITEVNVCALSGKVVDVQKESPEDQAKEKDEDVKESKHQHGGDKDGDKDEDGEKGEKGKKGEHEDKD
jgi:Peptidase propeptide and YPEB domain